MAKLAIAAAAAGVGRPANDMWSSLSSDSTLKRASRSAAQQTNNAAIVHTASLWRLVNCGHIFTSRIAGARPNDTRSHRLSSWAPKSLVRRVSRATWPSTASKNMASRINAPESIRLCVGSLLPIMPISSRAVSIFGAGTASMPTGFSIRASDHDREESAHEIAEREERRQNGDGANRSHVPST